MEMINFLNVIFDFSVQFGELHKVNIRSSLY